MRKAMMLLVLLGAGILGSGCGAPGYAQFTLGERFLDENDWAPCEDQFLLGFAASREIEQWPVELEVGCTSSLDEGRASGIDCEASVVEYLAGARKTVQLQGTNTSFYFGGGMAMMVADFEAGSAHDDDVSLALYFRVGMFWDLDGFYIGFDLRDTFASDIELGGWDGDADGPQFGLTLGWAWQ